MADSEEGLKWWLRYIIVPLIGGGGIIGIVIAIISRPQFPRNTVPHSAPINQVIPGTPDEKASIPVAELRRVSHTPTYCYHYTNFPHMQGSVEMETPFEKLRDIEFLVAPNTLHVTYRDGKSHEGLLAKDKLFDHPYIGFSGFSEIGEVFAWAADVGGVRFGAVR